MTSGPEVVFDNSSNQQLLYYHTMLVVQRGIAILTIPRKCDDKRLVVMLVTTTAPFRHPCLHLHGICTRTYHML